MKKNLYRLFRLVVIGVFALTAYSLSPGAKTMHLDMPGIVTIQTK
ncbi:hypothetical protein [Comamonas sp. 23]